jgi:Mor family transcriptional regulator
MQLEKLNIDNLLTDNKFKEFYSLGLIDEIALRNLQIKNDYNQLRKSHSMIESISQLSQKYFLSFDSINSILFRERNKKSVLDLTF